MAEVYSGEQLGRCVDLMCLHEDEEIILAALAVAAAVGHLHLAVQGRFGVIACVRHVSP